MSKDKKMCPFCTKLMNPQTFKILGSFCCEEDCMAWGEIHRVAGSNANTFMGCKLIEKDK